MSPTSRSLAAIGRPRTEPSLAGSSGPRANASVSSRSSWRTTSPRPSRLRERPGTHPTLRIAPPRWRGWCARPATRAVAWRSARRSVSPSRRSSSRGPTPRGSTRSKRWGRRRSPRTSATSDGARSARPPCCWLRHPIQTASAWPTSPRVPVRPLSGGRDRCEATSRRSRRSRRSWIWGWRRSRRATVRRASDSSACAPDGRSVTRIPPRPSPTSFPSRKRGWRPPRSRSGWVCPTSPPARWMPRTRHGPPRASTARRFHCGNDGRRSSRS